MHFDIPSRRLRREFESRKCQLVFLRGDLRAIFQAIGQSARGQALERTTVWIIRVHNGYVGRARARALEEAALGGKIFLERFVIIEMVAREIGEHGRGEMASPQAVHGQRVRACFHHDSGATFIAYLSEHLLKIERFGRGVNRVAAGAWRAIPDRADQAGFLSRGAQDRIDQVGRRRFAVRSRDAHKLQSVGGLAVKSRAYNR